MNSEIKMMGIGKSECGKINRTESTVFSMNSINSINLINTIN